MHSKAEAKTQGKGSSRTLTRAEQTVRDNQLVADAKKRRHLNETLSRTYMLVKGRYLRDQLQKWTYDTDWTVNWSQFPSKDRIKLSVNARFTGSLVSVFQELNKTFEKSGIDIALIPFTHNKVLVVTDRQMSAGLTQR